MNSVDRDEIDCPKSYYAETLGQALKRGRLTTGLGVDVCVIGAGLAGLTTALELLRQGKTVAVLEAKRVAWGASGRNGGFVASGFANSASKMLLHLGQADGREAFQLSVDGVDYVRRQISKLNLAGVLQGVGELEVYRYQYAEGAKADLEEANTNLGQDITFLNTDETRCLLKSERYHQALYDPKGFHIDPLKYAHGLANEIERLGGQIFEKTKAKELVRSGSSWRVSAADAELYAQHVVLCTSAYDFKLYPRVSRAMQPVATYVMATEPMPDALDAAITTPAMISDTRRAGDYYRRLPDGRLLWGGRITTRQSQPRRLSDMMINDMLTVYPQLAGAKPSHAWVGLMGYALHSMPLIGKVEEGLWMATAFGGHGLNTTAMAGCLISGAIANGDDRYKLFSSYRRDWAGGVIGRAGVQLTYWGMRLRDGLDERKAS
jgi:glycine/D-amino acid oxidase-like deaminating enzyme